MSHTQKVRDTNGQLVRLQYFLVLDLPEEPYTRAVGGDLVPLIAYNSDGTWTTPNGRVRVRDVWEVEPVERQTPFTLESPWQAKVLLFDAPPDLQAARVTGWDGKAWLTDKGRARHLEALSPVDRTIDDEWDW